MEVRVLSARDVEKLLPMRDCIQVMRDALAALARGKALVPLRMVMRMPDASGFLGLMPGHIDADGGRDGALGMKAVSVFPGNARRGIDTHQGAVLLFEADTGRLSALMDGATITAIRTAAVSGVATDLLARKDAAELAILGAGVQARTHLDAITAVRPIQRVRVWSRNPQHAAELVKTARAHHNSSIEPVPTAEAAVRGADIVVTATNSRDPVLADAWIAPGVHVNAMGSNQAQRRELPGELILRADVIAVDSLEQARMESGDLLLALDPDRWGPNIVELKDVKARPSPTAITIFKSNGIAAEDVASAGYIYEKALAEGRGKEIDVLGG